MLVLFLKMKEIYLLFSWKSTRNVTPNWLNYENCWKMSILNLRRRHTCSVRNTKKLLLIFRINWNYWLKRNPSKHLTFSDHLLVKYLSNIYGLIISATLWNYKQLWIQCYLTWKIYCTPWKRKFKLLLECRLEGIFWEQEKEKRRVLKIMRSKQSYFYTATSTLVI